MEDACIATDLPDENKDDITSCKNKSSTQLELKANNTDTDVLNSNITQKEENERNSEESVTKSTNDEENQGAAETVVNSDSKVTNKHTEKKEAAKSNAAQNKSNEDDEYAHVTYAKDGSAIYIDPNTNHKYKWSSAENNWLPCDESATTTNNHKTVHPYENEHYKWCSETHQWLPKVQMTETEHYKWCAEKNEWIAKTTTTVGEDATATTTTTDRKYDINADGERIYTDKDGTVFFWDVAKKAWFPKIDDDFMARYQMNYGFIDNTSASEEEELKKQKEEAKRKAEELARMEDEARAATEEAASTSVVVGSKRKAAQEPPKWFDLDPERNTKVYVSNLPLDITIDEFAELMSKCGMIMRDPQTQKQKLKLYAEADGQLKGDGLCDYIKVESVNLALNILDDYNLRGNKIHVQHAKFQMRGEYNPSLKPKRKKKDKEKLQKMKEKLFDWRPEKMRGERSKNEKIVIIKNLFEPEIFEKEVQLILEYQNDLREECVKCGIVRKVVVYDRHAEGVAQVNMATPEEADLVIKMMHGRFFGKRQLTAEHWDGKTKYKIVESETEVQKRLTNWDQFLESEVDKKDKIEDVPEEETFDATVKGD